MLALVFFAARVVAAERSTLPADPTAPGALLASSAPAAATASIDPICDLFANGYDPTGNGPCASCFDATVDFDESDVDCGGGYCKGCATGQQCTSNGDCQSGLCTNMQCAAGTLLISQVQTRGDGGASDEFVELYNPGVNPVVFDATWTLLARSTTAVSYSSRVIGANQSVPAHGHILFAGSAYNNPVTADAALSSGITDASSVVLQHNDVVVDALCFYYDATTQQALASGYTCEGTPVSNLPHDNSAIGNSNTDVSLERKPGGALGNAEDTGDNAADFSSAVVSDPHNTASPGVP